MPEQHRRWMEGWGDFHPHWERRLWTEKNRPRLRNEATFKKTKVPAQWADIISYEVVHQFGGIYLDTDMECLKSIDRLLDGIDAFTAESAPGEIAVGIFGAVPGHQWLDDVIGRLPDAFEQHPHDNSAATGPRLVESVTHDHPEVTVFAPEYFYPYGSHEPSRAGGPFPNAYAVHHWFGSWVDPEDKFLEDFPIELERELRALLPDDARVIAISERVDLDLGGRAQIPFIGREGMWSNPEDSAEALAEFERLTSDGWDWVVVLELAYWWYDFYPELMSVVEQRALAKHAHRRFTAYQLRRS